MRTKRLRKPGESETDPSAQPLRRTRVRNRLLVSVALCSVAVLTAGAPGVVDSSDALNGSQQAVERATLHQRAIALAHSLSDERDDMVAFVADGRRDEEEAGATPAGDAQRARVDRQVTDVLASDAVTPPLRQALEALPATRQEALSRNSTPYGAFQAYSAVIGQLHDVSRSVARGLPGEDEAEAPSAVATTEAIPHLGRAVEQASATRGFLRGALTADGPQRRLTEAARLARVREQAALADFEQTAGAGAGETYDKTVTGTDVGLAEKYVEALTTDGVMGTEDRSTNRERVVSALSARIDRMRSVQSSLAAAEVDRLESRRDDRVTALELRIALVGLCLLLAAGVSVHTARSLSRPLSVLKRGSRRLASSVRPSEEAPVRFTGRNDEFAEVVASLNELRETSARLHTRLAEVEEDNARLTASRDEIAAERRQLREECEELRCRLEAAHGATHGTFVHLGLRTLGLVERQLGLLEALEAEESDPEELASLFKLDHLATRMRRASENLLLLAGAEHSGGHHQTPVPLLDVLRAALSEIERYERVQLSSLPPHAQVSGFAADDVSHLVAELLDNATAFSAPDADVTLSAWMLENGEIMLSVQDSGIGVPSDRLTALNARLGVPEAQDAPGTHTDSGDGLGNGLYVVARLAARHGLRVQLREQKAGGIAAVVVLPRTLLPDRPVPGAAGTAPETGGTGQYLPGSVAEANSNALPSHRPQDAGSSGTQTSESAPALPVRVPGAGTADAGSGAGGGQDPAPHVPESFEEGGDPLIAAAEATAREHRADEAVHGTGDAAWSEAAPGAPEAPVPEQHARAEDTAESTHAVRDDAHTAAPGITDKGLPKRTPKHVATDGPPRPHTSGGANADELRRRLGGFQRGARDGHRDAAAEVATQKAAGAGGTDEEAQQ
ncbi:nitrate- and nitrite sensing domain-containing protein [Streptomyces sp. TR02-1]|uniref:sensor histidine kinase n=1 Tax=Streptomyces sp. TR02-1 TaxID=3385977 RepID=UPI0039A1E7B4